MLCCMLCFSFTTSVLCFLYMGSTCIQMCKPYIKSGNASFQLISINVLQIQNKTTEVFPEDIILLNTAWTCLFLSKTVATRVSQLCSALWSPLEHLNLQHVSVLCLLAVCLCNYLCCDRLRHIVLKMFSWFRRKRWVGLTSLTNMTQLTFSMLIFSGMTMMQR